MMGAVWIFAPANATDNQSASFYEVPERHGLGLYEILAKFIKTVDPDCEDWCSNLLSMMSAKSVYATSIALIALEDPSAELNHPDFDQFIQSENTLTSLEYPFYRLIDTFALLETWRSEYCNGKFESFAEFDPDAYRFLTCQIPSVAAFRFLRSIFLIPVMRKLKYCKSESKLICDNLKKIIAEKDLEHYGVTAAETVGSDAQAITDMVKNIIAATSQIEEIVADGDTVVLVGNTPQFLFFFLERSTKQLNLKQLALSGTPGYYRSECAGSWITDFITPRGLENYQAYIRAVFATWPCQESHIYFVNTASTTCGTAFLIQQIRDFYQESPPEMIMLTLNASPETWIPTHFNETVPIHYLGLAELAKEQIEEDPYWSIMTLFPAWKWDEWSEDSLFPPTGAGGQLVLAEIQDILESEDAMLA